MTQLFVAITFFGFVLWLIARLAQRAFRNLPPGPKGLPFIGDIPHAADQAWMSSPQRKDDYGDTSDFLILPKMCSSTI